MTHDQVTATQMVHYIRLILDCMVFSGCRELGHSLIFGMLGDDMYRNKHNKCALG